MKMHEMFPSRFLSKDDLPVSRVFTIEETLMEEVESEEGKSDKPIIYFEESKPLVLNKTNAEILKELYGEDSDLWVGKKVEAYVDPSVRFGTKKIGGIRLKKPEEAQPQ